MVTKQYTYSKYAHVEYDSPLQHGQRFSRLKSGYHVASTIEGAKFDAVLCPAKFLNISRLDVVTVHVRGKPWFPWRRNVHAESAQEKGFGAMRWNTTIHISAVDKNSNLLRQLPVLHQYVSHTNLSASTFEQQRAPVLLSSKLNETIFGYLDLETIFLDNENKFVCG